MSVRINLATCSNAALHAYVQARHPYVERGELIFAAGALDNQRLLKELGSYEASRWMEGRRAADPTYNNVYYG